ncbi:MAG: HAMP domain-containing sensor histidine kinase [Campylobacterota bacterium]|nr:HAMP domain-containing sensor histidine kinase [Campylobacterota bacterium]
MEYKKEILETIVHDLKSPLTVLKGTMDFLTYDLEDNNICDTKCKSSMKIMKRATKDIEEMVDSILVTSLIESDHAIVEPNNITNLTYLLREYSKSFTYEAVSKDIKFKTYIQRNLPEVNIDFKRVKNHILNNIITNAIKFTPKEGTIKLSAFEDIDSVVIAVEDSGPGIPQKERKNVFKKSNKLNTKSLRAVKSFGLGLYNAEYFTKLMDGEIYVTDSPFNGGASFVVKFPKI